MTEQKRQKERNTERGIQRERERERERESSPVTIVIFSHCSMVVFRVRYPQSDWWQRQYVQNEESAVSTFCFAFATA